MHLFYFLQYIHKLRAYLTSHSDAVPSQFKDFPLLPESFKYLQKKFWVNCVLDYQANLSAEVQSKLDVLARYQSHRISIDHTFRVVKNVIAIVPADSVDR